jgi:hypothetical protein
MIKVIGVLAVNPVQRLWVRVKIFMPAAGGGKILKQKNPPGEMLHPDGNKLVIHQSLARIQYL